MKPFKPAFWTAVLAALVTAAPAFAQPAAYPSKPITMVVGFAPGGISDVLSRALAARLTQQMGQNVIVENKPGAGTTIASAYIANAAPDGYTIMLQDVTTHAINAAAYKKLRYDTWNDFTLVSLVASTPLMLVSSLASGAKDVQGLVSLVKSKPDQLAYASSGNGAITHLSGEYFKSLAGINALHVPYKGSSPATQAIIAGEVVYTFSTMPPAVANVKGGKIYGLAVTSGKRVNAAPDVPTLKEAGVPLEILLYSGIMGPKGMPPAIVERLGAEVKKALASPEMKLTLANIGAEDLASSPAEFAALAKVETEKMATAVKIAGVVLD
ncbi:MAG: tripartite tricarboxylate transporter substrate binding protein [Burkholderiales bacterium]|nr:tripartite tricarboxylate transporter substrate binding protein [Burkholderiales bacterium]MCZ8295220.1 tripartite tricarboxylate transporter substrate binding protein [Hylemonella sp.]MDZ4074632.1 tripartite tricarboxylate transporter substrate binding protein [Hylemonella sp.]